MTWSWSHTDEAYNNACRNLSNFTNEDLCIIYAEWHSGPKGAKPESSSSLLDTQQYDLHLIKARALLNEKGRGHLKDQIWCFMSQLRNCTVGGWYAWCCPYGCVPHMVSFDRQEEEGQ